MIEKWIERLLAALGRGRYEIGREGDVYLTRWVLWGDRFGPGRKVFLHRFHRSDTDAALHDHPWDFWSLILWGGYWEHTKGGRRWYGPFSLLRRPAEWTHRVELDAGRRAWTLIWASEKRRSWGFHCPKGWTPWREVADNEAAGRHGCGEG